MFNRHVDMRLEGAFDPSDIASGENVAVSLPFAGSRQEADRRLGTCAAALFGADLLAFLCSVMVALLIAHGADMVVWAKPYPPIGLSDLKGPLCGLAVWFAAAAAYLDRCGHYRTRIPFWSQIHQILKACGFALLAEGFVEFSTRAMSSRQLLCGTWLLLPLLMVAFRWQARRLLTRAGLWELRTLIVGEATEAAHARLALMSEPSLGYRIVGVLPAAEALPLLQPTAGRSRGLLAPFDADRLILAPSNETDGDFREIVAALAREQFPFAIVPQLQGAPVWGCDRVYFFSHDAMLLRYRNNLRQPVARAGKVVFDLCLAGLLLLLSLPVLLVIAVLIRRDGGPVLFAHTRIGAGGRRFACFKFRTMVVDSDRVLLQALAADPERAAEWAATRKLRADPRVTPIGRFLRSTSLDELPQLFNVLRLEMSIVGPRPIVGREIARYGEDIAYYYETRPGITGLWQVSGRSDTTYEQRVQLDSWYVRNWTLWHDITILAKTLPAVLHRRGAC